MFKETADIQTADMLKLPVPEAHYHSVVLKPSETQKEMVASLSERAERVRNKMVDSSVDNMLLITNDGRKLALDQRLMNDMLPDSETSKVGACAENVFDIWQRTADRRSTQMVFCDLSTPHGDGKFNVYDDLRNKLIAKGVPMTMTVAAICGFAGVITGTDAFQSMIDAITSINIAPILICWVVVALMCMLTGGSSTGQLVALPIIAPKLQALGLSTSTIHRVSAFAATTLDSMPYSGSILMLLPMCHMKLKEVYPALFVTTVIATTIGTAVVTLVCTLFPGLG